MKKKISFTQLLNKKVNRKEFLLHVGVIVLLVSGIGGLLKTLSDPQPLRTSRVQKTQKQVGFGTGSYGGSGKGKS